METRSASVNTLLTKRIMRRIYLVWTIRALLNPIFLKTVVAGVFFWRSTEYVSYVHVIANAPRLTDVGNSINFARGAVIHAEGTTILLLLGVLVMTAWLLVDIVRRAEHIHA